MRKDLFSILVCPDDKAKLTLDVQEAKGEEVLEGTLTCTACGFVFRIEGGIPNLLPKALQDGPVGA